MGIVLYEYKILTLIVSFYQMHITRSRTKVTTFKLTYFLFWLVLFFPHVGHNVGVVVFEGRPLFGDNMSPSLPEGTDRDRLRNASIFGLCTSGFLHSEWYLMLSVSSCCCR